MGFTLETGISAAAVFVQGLLSFFSPCVLPLVPLYLGYLAGGLNEAAGGDGGDGADAEGTKLQEEKGSRLRLFLRVLCFTLGISGAFFVLGLGASAAGSFFREQRMVLSRIGGLLIILFALYQLGLFGNSKVIDRERRLPLHLEKMAMSPVTALIMGFAFSFAWTPCVGPALTSVLLMAGSAQTSAKGFLLIGVYTLGFILPFLAAGIFTARLLGFFRRHMTAVKYTVKIGGVIMLLIGIVMFVGKMNDITGYLSGLQNTADVHSSGESGSAEDDGASEGDSSVEAGIPGYELELKDQFGKTHTLADYKGKVIFLNFWATWCGPCRNEMPDIQKLYEEYSAQGEDAEVVILGVASPGLAGEGTVSEITGFMEENGYTYPVLMDESGEMMTGYGITAFPTTFMITKNGEIYGYVPGQLTEELMRTIIEQTIEEQ